MPGPVRPGAYSVKTTEGRPGNSLEHPEIPRTRLIELRRRNTPRQYFQEWECALTLPGFGSLKPPLTVTLPGAVRPERRESPVHRMAQPLIAWSEDHSVSQNHAFERRRDG